MSADVEAAQRLKLQCAGAYAGVIEVDSLETPHSVSAIRDGICGILGQADRASVKLIAGGRTLEDDSKSLKDYGVHVRSRILVIKAASKQAQAHLANQEERAHHLARLRDAAAAVAARGDGSSWNDSAYEFVLENQAGQGLKLEDPEDRKALVMGLALHEQGKQQLDKENFQNALDVLLLADEAFDMCNPAHLERVDNVGLLQIDIVWCFFQLRSLGELAAARGRLGKAQRSLERSHGPSQARMRHLHGNFCPELAIYVRLELLQGVAAFHSGYPKAEQYLQAAQAKWQRLQVSDDSLAALAALGFSTAKATRALRFCEGNLEQAAAFAAEQLEAEKKQKKERSKEKQMRKRMRRYGQTANGRLVDSGALNLLQNMGFEPAVVAEALKQSNNSGQAALDLLADPDRRDALHLAACITSAMQTNSQASRNQPSASNHSTDMSSTRKQPATDAAGLLAQALQAGNTGQDLPEEDADSNQQDVEMEAELAAGVREDPLAAYDVSVHQEGIAIQEYLVLVQQQQMRRLQ